MARGNGSRTIAPPGRPALEIQPPGRARVGLRAKQDAPIEIVIPKIKTETISVKVVQMAMNGLVSHEFGFKSKQEIRDKQAQMVKTKKGKRVPFEEYRQSMYALRGATIPKKPMEIGQSVKFTKGIYAVPVDAFKNAIISSCRFIEGVAMTTITSALDVLGDEDGLVPIKFSKVVFREDVVRIGKFPNKVADLRYRGEYRDWSVDLEIEFSTSFLSPQSVVNLVEHAGYYIGVGDWRKEKKGRFGKFAVAHRS